jgi:hypothetical protein
VKSVKVVFRELRHRRHLEIDTVLLVKIASPSGELNELTRQSRRNALEDVDIAGWTGQPITNGHHKTAQAVEVNTLSQPFIKVA